MLFYADKTIPLQPREKAAKVVAALNGAAAVYRRAYDSRTAALQTHAGLVGALIDQGELHQAVADRLNPGLDEAFPQLDRMAASATMVGRCIYRSTRLLGALASRAPLSVQDSTCLPSITATMSVDPAAMADLLEIAAFDVAAALPVVGDQLQARVPEGYAFYSLYPEMYLASAERVLWATERRTSWTVIGIRSIGSSLAPLVAGYFAEMGSAVRVETLRPRGHPFDRYVELGPLLRRRFEEDAEAGAGFIVVDEGPGLTCSSFLSVASALSQLGVQEDRLSIIAAWQGAPSIYASEDSRRRWGRLRVFYTDAAQAFDGWRRLISLFEAALEEPATKPDGRRRPPAEIQDLSYGRWRALMYQSPDQWPVVHRSTERTKLLIRYSASVPAVRQTATDPLISPPEGRRVETHFPILAKFAGLGGYGREKFLRAEAMADAGFGLPVIGLAYGFILYRFMEGAHPMSAKDLSPWLMAHMVRYYAFIARRFPVPAASRFETLSDMILTNAQGALGMDGSSFVQGWRPWKDSIDNFPLALIDGKPQPHEWLQMDSSTADVFLKSDGDDHFRDHTLVGEQNILWDLAGACEEWEMDDTGRQTLLQLWERETGDQLAGRFLDFYRGAYLAFRVAALHYAIHSTDEEDIRLSLQQEQWKYAQRLATAIALGPKSRLKAER